MPWADRGRRDWPRTRQKGPGEPEAEHAFWCRYWEVLRAQGVPAGREIWLERACHRFIRELKPRRLKEATPEDVTNFLGLLGLQPDSAGWKIRQTDQALRILFQELVHCPWAARWPVGLPELDGWMEGPEGGGQMPIPADAAQARFAEQFSSSERAWESLWENEIANGAAKGLE